MLEEAGVLYTYQVTDRDGHPCTDMSVLRTLAVWPYIPCGQVNGVVVSLAEPDQQN